MPSMLTLFDAPVMETSCPQRSASTVPLQSLALLNSDFVRTCARALAERLDADAGPGDNRRIERALLLTSGRPPLPTELAESLKFLQLQRQEYRGANDAELRAWTDWCQMLLAGMATLYVE